MRERWCPRCPPSCRPRRGIGGVLAGANGVARPSATIRTTPLATRGAPHVALMAATSGARAVARLMGPSPAACGPPDRWKAASGCWLAAARAAISAPLAGCRDRVTGVDAAGRSAAAARTRRRTTRRGESAARRGPTDDVPRRATAATWHPAGGRHAPATTPPRGRRGPWAPGSPPPAAPAVRPGSPMLPLSSPTESTPTSESGQPLIPPREAISRTHISAPTTWDGLGRLRKYVYTPHPNWGYQRTHGRGHSLWEQPGCNP